MTSGSKAFRKPTCKLCDSETIPGFPEEHQKLLTAKTSHGELSAHFFCLMFSSGLGQRGDETEGLQGFLSSDIWDELKRGSRLKCVYCKKKGATVGCARPQCKKSYHLPCGMTNNSLQQYFDQFKSFCSSHRPLQKLKPVAISRLGSGKTDQCSICQDDVGLSPSPKSVWTPCCGAFFHPACIQSMALSAGAYHFRCPLCNNDKKFVMEMKQFGIYIPERDASWESSGQTASPGVEKRPECRARICFCQKPDHRFYDSSDSSWEILRCFACGFKGIHARCGGLDEYVDPHWYCYACRRVAGSVPAANETDNRPIVAVWGTAVAVKPTQQTTESFRPPKAPAAAVDQTRTSSAQPAAVEHIPKDFKLKVPIKTTSSDLMTLTLEEIIVKGLDEKLRETNYRSKIYKNNAMPALASHSPVVTAAAVASQSNADAVFATPGLKSEEKTRQRSHDSNSPGDSDYESAQEAGVPNKIRRLSDNGSTKGADPPIPTSPTVIIRKSGNVANGFGGSERKLQLNQSDFIDQKIQNSIKEFFREPWNTESK